MKITLEFYPGNEREINKLIKALEAQGWELLQEYTNYYPTVINIVEMKK